MLELKRKDAVPLIESTEQIKDIMIQKGESKFLIKYHVEPGWLVEYYSTEKKLPKYVLYDLDDEPDLKEVAYDLSSNEDEDKEIELYRWGLEDPIPADNDTFGAFRILLMDQTTGSISWLKEKGKVVIIHSFSEAQKILNAQVQKYSNLSALII